mmetsp:Transcript_15916/g.16051  ORF Transcript_15916/g.16051 Transcript_15916/m.16051 type:complete len:435 (+) Transcript_15916:871-2175(+)
MWEENIEPETKVLEEVARACQLAVIYQKGQEVWDGKQNLSSDESPSGAESAAEEGPSSLPTTVAQVEDLYRPQLRSVRSHRKPKNKMKDFSPDNRQVTAANSSRLSLNMFSRAAASIWLTGSGSTSGSEPSSSRSSHSGQTAAGEPMGTNDDTKLLMKGPKKVRTTGSLPSSIRPRIRRSLSRDAGDFPLESLSADSPYGFSRQGAGAGAGAGPPSRISGSPTGEEERSQETLLPWSWQSVSVVISAGRNAVHVASPALTTQVLLGEHSLNSLYAGIHIDLFSPFGTACPNPRCRHPLSLMEVRQGWAPITDKYTTRCPNCKREFVPRFTVHCDSQDWIGSEGRGSVLWCEWLSPWVLRKQVLSLAENEGVESLLSPSLQQAQRIVIFWNLIVCFRLLGLPYAFLLCNYDSTLSLARVFSVPLDSGKPSPSISK